MSASGGAASAARPEGASEISSDRSSTDLVSWLRSQLDADERIARAVSTYWDGSTPTGERWRWECDNCDTPIPITPVTLLDEFLKCPNCGRVGVGLRSLEEYPTGHGTLMHLVVKGAEEQRPVDALHIANHDPAHTLRTVAASRAILAEHDHVFGLDPSYPGGPSFGCRRCHEWDGTIWADGWCNTVRALASIYEDRPGFDPSWRAE